MIRIIRYSAFNFFFIIYTGMTIASRDKKSAMIRIIKILPATGYWRFKINVVADAAKLPASHRARQMLFYGYICSNDEPSYHKDFID